jgi:hypothetical protein
MKKPKTLEQFFETQTDAQKDALLTLRLSCLKVKQKELKTGRKNPFQK